VNKSVGKDTQAVQAGSLASDRLAQGGIVVARLVIGYLWITQLSWKMPPTFGCPANFAVSTSYASRTSGLCDWVGLMANYSILPLHAALVKSIVIPNIAWMGWFIWLMEVFIAVSLVFGVVSRLGAAVGIIQGVNLFIGLIAVPNEWYWSYGMLITLHVIFVCIPPGRVLGIDAWLRRRLSAAGTANPWVARLVPWLT
jgi:thiosulfate dehydrogenase [quinone] large subunit